MNGEKEGRIKEILKSTSDIYQFVWSRLTSKCQFDILEKQLIGFNRCYKKINDVDTFNIRAFIIYYR